MADYSQLKVPDLKKHLQERGLAISGNKADLVARLQEHDKKGAGAATAGDDEIDWDEDDNKATTEVAAAAVPDGGQGRVKNPVAVPNQILDVDQAKTTDLKVNKEESDPNAAEEASVAAPATEAAKQDFSIGIQQTDAEKEATKRAERAKRFGLTVNDEEQKKAERARKFGVDSNLKESVVKGLDSALPERRAKRGREGKDGKEGGRSAKRQTPDRRTEPAPKAAGGKKATSHIVNDPVEKAKAEARAKRFLVTE